MGTAHTFMSRKVLLSQTLYNCTGINIFGAENYIQIRSCTEDIQTLLKPGVVYNLAQPAGH